MALAKMEWRIPDRLLDEGKEVRWVKFCDLGSEDNATVVIKTLWSVSLYATMLP